jgi:hypothetical protein
MTDCEWCGEPLPSWKRADARYCNSSCRGQMSLWEHGVAQPFRAARDALDRRRFRLPRLWHRGRPTNPAR